MTLGQRIRARREALGLSQEQVAEKMGVSRQAVGKWESDDARPGTDNLIRLAALLEMEVQELAAGEPAPLSKRAFPWRWIALGFAGLSLILALILFASLARGGETDSPGGETSSLSQEQPPSYPESIRLERETKYDFAPALTASQPAEEALPQGWEEHILCQLPLGDGTLLAVAVPVPQEGASSRYNLWAVTRPDPEAPWTALARFADDCEHPEQLQWDAFRRTLGYSGWRLTLPESAYGSAGLPPSSYYFSLDDSGEPAMAFALSGTYCGELDVDGDGERELLSLSSYDWGQFLEIYDLGGEGFYLYSLKSGLSQQLALDGEGFYFSEVPEGPRYPKLRDGALWREDLCGTGGDPTWDALTPDVMDVTISFAGGGPLSSGQDPDAVLARDSGGGPLPTDRQYARLALQCLYELTGWKPERVWAQASEFTIYFSLYEDGFNGRSFFTFDKWYDPEQIPALYLTWAEEADWSPLSAVQAARHMGTELLTGMELARAWYDRLPLISGGPIVDEGTGPYFEPALFLADGRSYRVETDDALHVLTFLQGPYPQDFVG